jgi:hypothetical protein
MDLTEIGREGGDWIHLAKDRDRWRHFVNMVKNLGFHKKGIRRAEHVARIGELRR